MNRRSLPHGSGFDAGTNICWDFRKPGERWRNWRCLCPVHRAPHRQLIVFGRCRSGQRWFWSAHVCCSEPHAKRHGYADDEPSAWEAAIVAIIAIAGTRPALAHVSHGAAADTLKELNAEKRRARPPSNATDTKTVEYLYGRERCWSEWPPCPCYELTGTARWNYHLVKFQIIKKTKRRIYYARRPWPLRDGDDGCCPLDLIDSPIRFVDRQTLERDGEIWSHKTGGWWEGDARLYLEPPPPPKSQEAAPPDVRALKAAMAAAHPDKGGSNAAFITARANYLAALRTSPARQARSR
jgi:hypothetical protein